MTTMLPGLQDVLTTTARPLAPDGLPGPVYGGVIVLPDVKLGRRAADVGVNVGVDVGVDVGLGVEAGMDESTEESSLHGLLDVIGRAMETVGTEQARHNLGEIAARLGRFQAALSAWCEAREATFARIESRAAELEQREARLTMREAAAREREDISRLKDETLTMREASLHRALEEYAARQRRLIERETELHRRECLSAVATAARMGRFFAAACSGRGLVAVRQREGVGQPAVARPGSPMS